MDAAGLAANALCLHESMTEPCDAVRELHPYASRVESNQ